MLLREPKSGCCSASLGLILAKIEELAPLTSREGVTNLKAKFIVVAFGLKRCIEAEWLKF
jgi:hypothetical protein